MAFSWGSRDVLWIRCEKELYQAVEKLLAEGRDEGFNANDLLIPVVVGAAPEEGENS